MRDGARVHVQTWSPPDGHAGERPPILILDGIGCSGWAFRRIVPKLSARRQVTLMHYRGHGHSPNPPRPWHLGLDVLADDAREVIDTLGLGRPLIVGFSMGFQVTLELFRRHPEVVGGIVCISGPAGRALATFQGTEAFGHVLPFLLASTRMTRRISGRVWRKIAPSDVVRDLGHRTGTNASRLPIDDFGLYMRSLSEISPDLFFTLLERAHAHRGSDVLPRIDVPTLVLAGGLDRFVPLPVLREIAFAIPTARWEVFRDATHALPAEYPREVALRIESLADELSGTA